jgi:glycosyltransferase involved in cell wall biosynthesis
MLKQVGPDFVFIEEEPTSVPGYQWAQAARSAGIPFGLQMDENLDRPFPVVAKLIRRWTLERAAFVAARSPASARLAHNWGYRGPTPVVPHGVPDWNTHPQQSESERPFTVGFAGRFVEEKGIWDLVEAVRGISGAHIRLIGNGPLREDLRGIEMPDGKIEVVSGIGHDEMPAAYSTLDVLVLPSRTTPTWAEQFGRVLVEAMWCGIPVVGSSSGEIPWVVETTGGGLVFDEGNTSSLRSALVQLRDHPEERQRLADAGRQTVAERFSVDASARDLAAAMDAAIATY